MRMSDERKLSPLILAALDLRRPACGFERFLTQFDIDDSIVTRLLLRRDVAVFDSIFNGPLRAIFRETGVDAPDAILDEVVISKAHRILRLFGRLDHYGNDFFFLRVNQPVSFDQSSHGITYQRPLSRKLAVARAIGVEKILRHQVGELDQYVDTGLFFLGQKNVFGMKRYAIQLTGNQSRQATRRPLGDELYVFNLESGRFQYFTSHDPIEAAHSAAGCAETLALQIGGGLNIFTDDVSLWEAWRHAPNLLCGHSLSDGRGVHRCHGSAFGDSDEVGGGQAAFELNNFSFDAMVCEDAKITRDVDGSMNNVGRRHRNAELHLTHFLAGLFCLGRCRSHKKRGDRKE